MIERLRTTDLNNLDQLAKNQNNINACKHINAIEATLDTQTVSDLDIEILEALSKNNAVKALMILYFLTKNVTLEYIRRTNIVVNYPQIKVSEYWEEISQTLLAKLKLSRYLPQHFNDKELENLASLAKDIIIDDLVTAELTEEGENEASIQMLLTGKISPSLKHINQSKTYIRSDRKLCYHPVIYNPFKFGGMQTNEFVLHPNLMEGDKNIKAIATIKFARPEITVFYADDSYESITTENINQTLKDLHTSNEIDERMLDNIKNDYPSLFLPKLDKDAIKHFWSQIDSLIQAGIGEANSNNQPLLIVTSEIHGSKDSFILNLILLMIARQYGIRHSFYETINNHHEMHGADAKSEMMFRLMAYSENQLGYDVFDLEASLHYKSIRSPYPYHEIPITDFGIPCRESSWVHDIKSTGKSAVLVVGTGHLHRMSNSELNNIYRILSIDCTGDREFSEMLSVTKYNHIDMPYDTSELSFDELVKLVEGDKS